MNNSDVPTLTLWDESKKILLPGWDRETYIQYNFGFCQISTKYNSNIYHGSGLSEELAWEDLHKELMLHLPTTKVV